MKARGFFILLLLFTTSCFLWWVIQLDTLNRQYEAAQYENLTLKSFEAQNELLWLGERDSSAGFSHRLKLGSASIYVNDSIWNLVKHLFPGHDFERNAGYVRVEPRETELLAIGKRVNRERNRQLGESVLFFLLLFTGFVWIYKGLVKALEINEQQNQFLLSITHELKTPISSTRLLFQTFLKRSLSRETLHEFYVSGLRDNNRLLILVESILLATRFDSSETHLRFETSDLSQWLKKEVESQIDEYPGGRKIRSSIEPEVLCRFDPMSLQLCLLNLVENARKYAEKGSIRINLIRQGFYALIQVVDQGPGIPDPEKKKVFRKFFRGSQDSKIKGTGLGLYIVSETMKRHKGFAWIEDARPHGTIVNLKIPIVS